MKHSQLNVITVKLNHNHLSSGDSIASAITWIFDHVDSAIILEDDIMPTQHFLENTEILLELFATNFEVGSILGSNFVPSKFIANPQAQYRATNFISSWGWATWADRWRHFEHSLMNWENYQKELPISVNTYFGRRKWMHIFRSIQDGHFDAWDYRWQFTNWKNHWISIVPNSNLVQNIGFTAEATHTFQRPWWFSDEVENLMLDLDSVSVDLSVDHGADRWVATNIHPSGNWYWMKTYLMYFIKRVVNRVRVHFDYSIN